MLQHIRHDDLLELRLDRPPANALHLELLNAIHVALCTAPNQGYSGVILSGSSGLFSGGLDVPTLLSLDRAGVLATWEMFMRVCSALANLPIPVVAALTGHSPAGGAVLGLFCDYRVMARANDKGPFKIGLNETQVGLVVPPAIQYALQRLVGERIGERLLVAGAMVDSLRAAEIGLVDELAEVDLVVPKAVAWLRAHLVLPRHAMLATRAIARRQLIAAIDAPDAQDLSSFVDRWYSPETQVALQALVAKLRKA